jgi:hypothetical protein
MANHISARGHVTAVLVLDMRRFVVPADRKLFETLRGSPHFITALRDTWPAAVGPASAFAVAHHPLDGNAVTGRMPTDEVAFLSGVFRLNAIQDYAVPLYHVHKKECVVFPADILDNVQFTNVFLEVWHNWEIYVRPTMTGMFVMSLRRRYERTTPLLRIAADVVSLQTAFDIPGALQRLAEFQAQYEQGYAAAGAKIRSIEAFLTWLDAAARPTTGQPGYAPVQWKLAMEVCRQFVEDVDLQLPINGRTLRLQAPERTIETPLHDSFLLYHVDELLAVEPILNKARAPGDGQELGDSSELTLTGTPATKSPPKIPVTPDDIKRSPELQQQIAGLMEGAVLRRVTGALRPSARLVGPKSYFPDHRSRYLDDVFACDSATWSDEMCVLTSRAAFVMPSRHARQNELLLSNFTASTGRVMYLWYWEAMERMFELAIEVRVLAHSIERGSADLLREIEQELTQVRHGMSRRDIRVNYEVLTEKVERVANMSRLLGLGQSLSTPTVWGQAEYAVEKARLLLQRQDVPLLMHHAERNVANLSELVNHIDELYLADLSESNNRLSFYLSILLSGLSLSVIIFTVISFWADAAQLDENAIPQFIRSIVPYMVIWGSWLSLALAVVALAILVFGIGSFTRNLVRAHSRRR